MKSIQHARHSIGRAAAAATAIVGLAIVAFAAAPQVTVIRGGHVVPIGGPDIDNGVVVVTDGKITGVGRDLAVPAGATVIEARGQWVLPGLVKAQTTIGLTEERGGGAPDEMSDPNTAQLRVLDGLNPFDKRFKRLVMGGITAALVTPGRANVIGGQPAVVRLAGRTADEMALRPAAGIKFSLGEGPKAAFGEKNRLPGTRMGAAYVVRKALLEAAEYARKPAKPKTDLALEALAQLLDGRATAYIEVYRADDIITALRLVDEFKLKAVFIGCTEGFRVATEIAKRNIPVITGQMGTGPKRFETELVGLENAGLLAKAGITVALQADDAMGMGIGAPEELALAAALAVKGGLPRETALRAVTLTGAELLGVGDRIGSLAPGKDADIALFSGDPLYYRSTVRRVLIAGQTVYEKTDK